MKDIAMAPMVWLAEGICGLFICGYGSQEGVLTIGLRDVRLLVRNPDTSALRQLADSIDAAREEAAK